MPLRGSEALQTDIKSSTLLSNYSDMDLIPLVESFEITLTNLLDMDAPIKKRTITLRSYPPLYSSSGMRTIKTLFDLASDWLLGKWSILIGRERISRA